MSSAERPGYHLPPGTLAPVDIDLDRKCLTRSAGASIGKKYLMAAAGLFWCFFVLMHLVGNFQLFLGAEKYNAYSEFLISLGKLLYVMEIALVLALLGHAVLGVIVSLQNSAARPVGYEVDRAKGDRNLASNTMIWTGILVIVFIVLHLLHFKYAADHPKAMLDGKEVTDFHGMVVDLFQSPLYVLTYLVAVAVLGVHLYHALQSSLRTLGWFSADSQACIQKTSKAFGIAIALGYASIPIWAILVKGAGS
ncbi:MAG: succinate dehydrogenase cytochrome b subunit [Planctomycetota bacterium]